MYRPPIPHSILIENTLTPAMDAFNTTNFMTFCPQETMKAKFASSCVSCGDEIKRGKEITKDTSGKWVHKHCASETVDLP